MAKLKVSLFHGSGSTPRDFWFPWLQDSIETLGHKAWAPALPNTDDPKLSEWLPVALSKRAFVESSNSVLIGHSSGCPLILSMLENLESPVRRTILVAGFAQQLNKQDPNKVLQPRYNWKRIKQNAGEVIIINSDNDPWGCDDEAGRYMFDRLGGTLMIRHGEGHMGSKTYKQPYREFPLLLYLALSTF